MKKELKKKLPNMENDLKKRLEYFMEESIAKYFEKYNTESLDPFDEYDIIRPVRKQTYSLHHKYANEEDLKEPIIDLIAVSLKVLLVAEKEKENESRSNGVRVG